MRYQLDERLIWFNGELIPIKDAKVMVFSPTAQYGLNVFEGIPCFWNKQQSKLYAFRLFDHYNRLISSAKLLQIDCPYNFNDMINALKETIKVNEIKEDVIARQTLFVDNFGSWSSEGPTHMFVVLTPKQNMNAEYNQSGLNVCIASWRRISDNVMSPRIKCGANYINSRMGQKEAIRNGYDTCIFLNENGKISEGPGSCFFMIKNSKLITPKITDSVLESITRDSVIKIAKYIGYDIVERTIDRTEIYQSDEAFLCGSSMGITPIYSIDKYKISDSIGKITSDIRNKYLEICVGDSNINNEWINEMC